LLSTEAHDIVNERWLGLAPPKELTVTEWAEENRVLSAKDSAEPGPYRVSRTPYAREPQDCLGDSSAVEEVILMWGSQTSKTTVGMNWIGYTIDQNPGPIMAMWPTINVAKRNSRQRLTPMFDSTPILKKKVSERKSRDEANTMLLKDFTGGVLAIVGANSGSDLSSMPMRDIFMDEVDRFPLNLPGEGRPAQLAEARQTAFSRRKRLKTSTPTTKGVSEIEDAYKSSDQCRYYVPCPHCGEFQPLIWGEPGKPGLTFEQGERGPVRSTIRYICVSGCEILEQQKTQMLEAGKWVAENPGDGRVRGFHLSSLYSPLGWLSWFDLAKEWCIAQQASAKGDDSLLRVFINTRLAETYEDTGEKADQHALKQRAPDIPTRTVHWGHFVRTAGVDVQGDRIEIHDWAWGRSGARQLVEREVFYGDPALPETEPSSPWAALTAYLQTPIHHASGAEVQLVATFIDTGGHHTQQAYVYCRNHRHQSVFAVKGSSIANRPIIGKPTLQDVNFRGDKIKKGVQLWPIGTDTAKSEIYGRLRVSEPGPGYVTLSKRMPDEVFEQLTSERLATKYVKGRPKLEWVKPPGVRNEALDCAVYALAAAHWRGIDRWREADWSKLQQRIEPKEQEPAPIERKTAPKRRIRGRIGAL
jgi:phage terminase large subunit GpA-like protein